MATLVASDGFRLHFRDDGPRDAPPLVLLHGLGSDGRTEQDLVDAIGNRLRVIRLDLRGHGGSAPLREPERFGWFDRAVADGVELLAFLGLERVAIHGGSLGAAVAVATGLHIPDRVTTLGIAYPAFGPGDDFSNPVAAALFEMVAQVGLTGLLDMMESAGPDVVPAAEMAAARENFGRQDVESMRACGTAFRGTCLVDRFDVLERLAMPALVIGRPGDALHPVELANEYVAHLPHSRLVLDDDAKPFFLRPAAHANLLVEFHS